MDRTGNSESKNILTDIDALLLILNDGKFEFYIIEGKNLITGFKTACHADLKKIISLSPYPDIFKEPVFISSHHLKAKGGYLEIKG